jgi:hypothetical protein
VNQYNYQDQPDIGDYLKVIACTAVMAQTIISYVLGLNLPEAQQLRLGQLYLLVKFTAPAFIFGILYTTIRIHDQTNLFDWRSYYRQQFSALLVPTFWWTLAYLLLMPWLQQVRTYRHNFGLFCWQFINGNAAPHLWYNTMMLQFIVLMPLFWLLSRWVKGQPLRGILAFLLTAVIYLAWLQFYLGNVFHNQHQVDWYLLDRLFMSFLIYGVSGCLAWMFAKQYNHWVKKLWWLALILIIAAYWLTDQELQSFGYPLFLFNATYYKPSALLYCLMVIALGSALCLWQQHKRRTNILKGMHFLSVYAYRAYLSNVFWSQLVWRGLRLTRLASFHPIAIILGCWLLTWILSFSSAYLLHLWWQHAKNLGAKLYANSRANISSSKK